MAGGVTAVSLPPRREHQRDHDHDAEHRRDHEPGDDPPPLDDRTSGLSASAAPDVGRPVSSATATRPSREGAVVTLVLLSGVLAPVVVREVAEPVVCRLLAGSAASSAGELGRPRGPGCCISPS